MSGDGFGLVGSTLDTKYRVDEVVGEGGFGIVYRGFHLVFEHPVAIKCLLIPASFDTAAQRLFLDRFKEEGKLLSRLSQHPNITRVFDFGETWTDKGTAVPYLVLEWLTGSDLEVLLQRRVEQGLGPYSEQQAVSLLRPVIDAIGLAHRAGVAHRDLKPSNILLTQTLQGATLKVLDFGVAKAMQAGEVTAASARKTTGLFRAYSPAYGAPEQFRSSVYGATGPWTDVHALGLLFVELTTGRPAYEGVEYADFYEAAVSPARPTPRARGALVSDAFEAVIARALARDPKERYQDAGELLQALAAVVPAAVPSTPGVPSEHDIAAALTAASVRPPPVDPVAPTVEIAPRQPVAGPPEASSTRRRRLVARIAVPAVAAVLALAMGAGWWLRARSRDRAHAHDVGATIPVPAGSFAMGADDGAVDQRPVHGVQVNAFELDRTEVTVQAYSLCVNAGACIPSEAVFLADVTDKDRPQYDALCNWGKPGRADHPMNCVDYHQAEAFCAWAGKRLPTEEEWEFAARGGEQGRTFPWGEAKPGPTVVNACDRACSSMAAAHGWKWTAVYDADDGHAATSPVGSYPDGAGRWGHLDLAGNVWEWTSSVYCPYEGDSKKCLPATRVARGGSWSSRYPGIFRGAYRTRFLMEYRSESVGFRCAKGS